MPVLSIRGGIGAGVGLVRLIRRIGIRGAFQSLDRDHVFVLGGPEDRHSLGVASRDANLSHGHTDQLTLIGHKQNLIGIVDGERRNQPAAAPRDVLGDESLPAPAGAAIVVGGSALAEALG